MSNGSQRRGCLPIPFAGGFDEVNVTRSLVFNPKNPCDNVSERVGLPEEPTLTSFVGPSGPTPRLSGNLLFYEGDLDNGNDYGSCDVVIMGRYEEPASFVTFLAALIGDRRNRGSWTARGTMTINPPNAPTFNPAQLVISPGGQGTVTVTVVPPCKYTLTLRHGDEHPQHLLVTPTVLTTDNAGTGTITVRDILNAPRGPVTVTATITAESRCSGGSDIVGTFQVLVSN